MTKKSGKNNDYVDSQSRSFLQQDQSINNIIMQEDFNYMDKNSRYLLIDKSQKTLQLLTDLKRMRLKNQKPKDSKVNIIGWDDEEDAKMKSKTPIPQFKKETTTFLKEEQKKEKEEGAAETAKIVENKKENNKSNNNQESPIDFKKPLLEKLERQIKENNMKIVEFEKKNPSQEKNPIRKDSGEEANLFKGSPPDNGIEDGDNIKNQINNKINNINKLLVGVINKDNKKEKRNIFSNDNKSKSKDINKSN